MTRTIHRLNGMIALIGLLAGCASADPATSNGAEERVGETQQRQLDPSIFTYRHYSLLLEDDSEDSFAFAEVVVTNPSKQAGSGTLSTSEGQYEVANNHEYWFVDPDMVGRLHDGEYHLVIQSSGSTTFATEVDLGTCTTQQVASEATTWHSAEQVSIPSGAEVFVVSGGESPVVTTIAFTTREDDTLDQ